MVVSRHSALLVHLHKSEHKLWADNNGGISVIDVTDPMAPAYCFVFVNGMAPQVSVPGRIPLSATEYAHAYYPLGLKEDKWPQMREHVNASISKLAGVKLVRLGMLAEAWPAEYQETFMSHSENAAPPVDVSVKPAVPHSEETGDIMNDRLSPTKSVLLKNSSFSDSAMNLSTGVVAQKSKSMDLAGHPLSPSQIMSLVSNREGLEDLDLSDNPNVTVDTVRA